MIRNSKKMLASVLIGLAGLVSHSAWAQLAVIVNPANPASSLSKDEVGDIFLGKTLTLPNGERAMLADLASAKEDFYDKATGKSGSQVKSTWSRLVFSGKAQPPKEFGSAAEVKAFVAGNANAIGYIDASAVDGSIKSVLKLD